MENVEKPKKEYKTFKQYYEDPEFKKRHREKAAEKIPCECGILVSRCNMCKHIKTKKHFYELELKNLRNQTDEKNI